MFGNRHHLGFFPGLEKADRGKQHFFFLYWSIIREFLYYKYIILSIVFVWVFFFFNLCLCMNLYQIVSHKSFTVSLWSESSWKYPDPPPPLVQSVYCPDLMFPSDERQHITANVSVEVTLHFWCPLTRNPCVPINFKQIHNLIAWGSPSTYLHNGISRILWSPQNEQSQQCLTSCAAAVNNSLTKLTDNLAKLSIRAFELLFYRYTDSERS